MKKDNTNEHTQIELFDESMNIFEVIHAVEQEENDKDEPHDIVCEKCISRAMTTCLLSCKNYSCFRG